MTMTLKGKLADPKRRLNGHVCVIPSAVTIQAIAAAGADYVVIDQEHAPTGLETVHAMIAATQGCDCAPLVRIPSIDEIAVKRVLDAGAEGVVFPLLRSAEDARRCVASLRYPPHGTRGWGPFVAHSRWRASMPDYTAGPANDLVCVVLIETREALADIEGIFAVEGVDAAIVAGFDLSMELGVGGQFGHPDYLAAVQRIEQAAFAAGVPLGANALTKEQSDVALAKGYRMVGAFDILWLKGAVTQSIAWMNEAPPA